MEKPNDVEELIAFMQGPDNPVLVQMIHFFSDGGRYLHPRELKRFWETQTVSEKNYYRTLFASRSI